MIVLRYELEHFDLVSKQITYVLLGTESYHSIEEVLLPSTPRPGDPIFFTKKFVNHPEYRWEVIKIDMAPAARRRTYVVTLKKRPQINKEHYLKNILAARRGPVGHVLRPWAIVEVEFGQFLEIGKANGDVRSTKRYTDTMQRLSMPKRRLAIVNQVFSRVDDLIQVIPISSKKPDANELACIEVTADLSNMVNYQKPSWAVCRMMQTVTASRIIAPLIQRVPHAPPMRDKGFRTLVRGPIREALKDAIMYGVAADSRVADAAALEQARLATAQLTSQVATLAQRVAELERNTAVYERWADEEHFTLADLQGIYAE